MDENQSAGEPYLHHSLTILRWLGVFSCNNFVINAIYTAVYFAFYGVIVFGLMAGIIERIDANGFNYYVISNEVVMLISITYFTYLFIYFRLSSDEFDAFSDESIELRKLDRLHHTKRLNCIFNKIVLFINGFIVLSCITMGFFVCYLYCPPENVFCTAHIYLYVPECWRYYPQRLFVQLLGVIYSSYQALVAGNIIMLSTFSCDLISGGYIDLQAMVKAISLIDNLDDRRQQVKDVIKDHYVLLHHYDRYNNLGRSALMGQIIATFTVITCIGLTLVYHFDIITLFHSLFYFVPLFLFATSGEYLLEQNNKLSDEAFYAIPWDGDLATAKDLLFLMVRCTHPPTLNVGGFTYYTRSLTVLICRGIYSTMTLLMQVAKRQATQMAKKEKNI